jgi:Cu(I)/Ag(I) efflux system membrane protein CusA/SilA
VRSEGWLGRDSSGAFDSRRALRDLENAPMTSRDETVLRIGDVATVALGPASRRGVLEKDGNEVVGGVVLMRNGENPLRVTERIKRKMREISAGLPKGVRIVPCYDRVPLIEGAIQTITGTVLEAMLTATVCVLLILLHIRSSFVIAATLPLAALASFAIMDLLRRLGIADIQANIMSLAGIAISIGILVDSSIVMTENALHRLRDHFGDEPVRGDTRPIVLAACLAVGRPIVFSILIMLLSFLPVFALGGIEGKMFRPLAFTKSFALASVAVLSITIVPALCTVFIRGRLRKETDSPIVRGAIEVYRPVLSALLDHPAVMAWLLGVTFVVGSAPIGSKNLFLGLLCAGFVATAALARTMFSRIALAGSLVVIALTADATMTPLGREFVTPLDEGMVMDMPITVPRASVRESIDDLKARDMILCRFPEVEMVVGKAGRAETATDPAPIDMIETMIDFHPADVWPRRKLRPSDAERQANAALDALINRKLVDMPPNRSETITEAVNAVMPRFDAAIREFAYQRNREFERGLAGDRPTGLETSESDPVVARYRRRQREHAKTLDRELIGRASGTFTRLILEELITRTTPATPALSAAVMKIRRYREEVPRDPRIAPPPIPGGLHHHAVDRSPDFDPLPELIELQEALARRFAAGLMLWKVDRHALQGFGGELDLAVQMPGWTNVWTMPIQNRVDMLATGVNTTVGIRVLGRSLDDVVNGSEAIAAIVKQIPGAVNVVADPIRGKGYLEILIDRDRASKRGVSAADVSETVEAAMGGVVPTTVIDGRMRKPVRVRYARDFRDSPEAAGRLRVDSSLGPSGRSVQLDEVADVRIADGPATIKGENGLLRNYVRLDVTGRELDSFMNEASAKIARLSLPEGIYIEWAGQFEHQERAERTLAVVLPIVAGLIFLVLYFTYCDFADALLMMLAVPGAIAGGVFVQWLMGAKFSVTVWVGYIACFGMATSTGIIMLVYLRDALAKVGPLAALSDSQLRAAVLNGAVQRLRPKLLTEGTAILGLAPLLWADGPGAEVIRPMVAPVLGGLLVADEVIDLTLPVLFYWVRRGRRRHLLNRS